jgi:hypothetical protein
MNLSSLYLFNSLLKFQMVVDKVIENYIIGLHLLQ